MMPLSIEPTNLLRAPQGPELEELNLDWKNKMSGTSQQACARPAWLVTVLAIAVVSSATVFARLNCPPSAWPGSIALLHFANAETQLGMIR